MTYSQFYTPENTSNGPIREYKIVVLGDGGVGKSALTIQFTQDVFVEEYDPTIEDCYRKQCEINGKLAILEILDTAGQEEYSAMRETYFSGGDAFLIVYSVTDRDSFEQAQSLYKSILRSKDSDYFPTVFVANKCDLLQERVVSRDEGIALAKDLKFSTLEVSAKRNINVKECFVTLIGDVKRYERLKRREMMRIQQQLKQQKLRKNDCTIL